MESSLRRINNGESQNTKMILKTAIASRITLLALAIIWRSIATPYDTSASINPPPDCLLAPTNHHHQSILFPRIATAIENGIVWDSVYFIRIAQCGGYEYEQTYAFLPLYPLCISLFSQTVLRPLIPLVGHRAVLALSGYALSNISFVFAALFLYRLSVIILKDSEASLRASILFCFNPASIFYSSIYSESLYALLSIGGLNFLMLGANNLATLWFALSGCARSNGVLNAGYIGFQTMHQAYEAVFYKRSTFLAVQVLVSGILRSVCVFVPFVAFQAYGYYNLCDGHNPDKLRPWCEAKIPLLYNFIQSHYWGVGFLRYFQLKQLPNFLLASPILSIAVCSIIHYVKLQPKVFLSLGFQVSPKKHGDANLLLSSGANTKNTSLSDREISTVVQDQVLRRRKHNTKQEDPPRLSTDNVSTEKLGDFSVIIIPFVLHLGFMVATAFFVMHVQVATRFLSSSPPIYWFASYVLASPGIQRGWRYLIWGYCAAYILLGSLLFSNFYPFT
uniref:GPI mannosyltransferase 2 isoform X2 n=1 Tax=Erigeron canadensis TaxID=72917 RepID=UPI001CB9AAC4|nr:GPI mannosyltransferase 2 isoform X2 [Erigeron canadensis]